MKTRSVWELSSPSPPVFSQYVRSQHSTGASGSSRSEQRTCQVASYNILTNGQPQLAGQMVTDSQEVTLYSPEELEMMGTTTTTEMTTTTTLSAMDYTAPLDQSVQMKLRPLLQSCLSLGSGLLDLADRDDLAEFIESINCTVV